MAALLFGALAQQVCLAQPPAKQPPAPVVAAVIAQDEVRAGQTFVATVMPSKRAVIGSAVDGRVVEFSLNEGDPVKKGQPLAQLLTETIELELKAEEAELEIRKQELLKLERGSRREEIEQAEARMKSASALKDYLAARRKRTESLFNTSQATSREERDEAVSAAVAAEQAHLAAKAAYALAVEGPRVEEKNQAKAEVAKQQAVVDRIRDQIKKYTIISRFDGFVTAEHTEIGAWVSRGDPVAEVEALGDVEVVAQVVEEHVPYIRIGTPVRVEVPALPKAYFPGTVIAINPQADVRARTFPVRVLVENTITEEGPVLRSGMTARVTLSTGANREALLVPKDALVLGGKSKSREMTPRVYVVDRDSPESNQGKVRPVDVELGVAVGTLIQVSGELEKGQLVVVMGNERLRPGQEVVVTKIVDTDGEKGKAEGGRRKGKMMSDE